MDDLERIVTAYQDAEGWLLQLIAQAVASGADRTAGVYRERLDTLRYVMLHAERYLVGLEDGLLSEIAEALSAGFDEGVAQAVASIPGEAVVSAGAVQALAVETTAALALQRPAILRSVQDGYRQVIQQVTTRAITSGMALDTSMQQALDQFANRGITSFVDNAGRSWSLDTYTRMALRTAQNRATNAGRQETFRTNGIQLIQTSWHRAAAPWCIPYQGKILSIDGKAGDRVVWDRVADSETIVHVTATLDEAEANGYHHPNCRHIDTAYIPGQPAPNPPDVPESEHEELQRQRAIERHIRAWKKREAVALTPQAQQRAKAKIRAWQAAQREHVAQHSFLRRNYSREQVRVGNPANAS